MDENNYWVRHLRKNHKTEISRIKQFYPVEKTIVIDVSKIISNEVFEKVIERPKGQIEEILPIAVDLIGIKERSNLDIRFINISKKTPIRDLRATKDERKLRSIVCLVKRVNPIQPKIIMAYFQCRAGHYSLVYSKHDKISKPESCDTQGCTMKKLEYLSDRDVIINRQFIYVQETLENLTGGIQPSSLRCELTGDLCNQISSGDRVILNGVLCTIPKYKGDMLQAEKDVFFEVNSIERDASDQEICLTPEDETEILKLAKRPDLYDHLTSSIAPSIIGMRLLKQAITLQLFGGKTRILPDGTRRRGYINILAVTDPGMAKTVLLQFVANVTPHGVYVSATTSSKVGLIAPLVRDELTGQYAIEPGPYMLASGGTLCLDEGGDLNKEEYKYLGECMDSGQCHIAKAGINATVKTEAALLTASNPNGGNYDVGAPLADQVKIPPAILSRYDLKILQVDTSSEEKDMRVAQFISSGYLPESQEQVSEYVSPDLLRKYISFARKIEPVTTSAVNKLIDTYWVKIRKECEEFPSQPSTRKSQKDREESRMRITHRQLVSLHHLAEAHARLRLSETVQEMDAQAAIDLFDMAFRNINTDPQGRLNMAMSEHRGQQTKYNMIGVIKDCIKAEPGISLDALLMKMEERSFKDKTEIILMVGKLLTDKNSEIMETKHDHYRYLGR